MMQQLNNLMNWLLNKVFFPIPVFFRKPWFC
jgi:hypothetical protein